MRSVPLAQRAPSSEGEPKRELPPPEKEISVFKLWVQLCILKKFAEEEFGALDLKAIEVTCTLQWFAVLYVDIVNRCRLQPVFLRLPALL